MTPRPLPASQQRFAPTIEVAGVPIYATTRADARRWVINVAAAGKEGAAVRLANAYTLALASRRPDYLQLLRSSGSNLPDGLPLTWFMKLRARREHSFPRFERVRGPSFFRDTLYELRNEPVRSFFLGGTDESLSALVDAVRSANPGIAIAGGYAPPFAPADELVSMCVEKVREAMPCIVWVGLGTPKQDLIALELAQRLGVVAVGVGAAFDFVSGSTREAPRVAQGLGLEWLYRLLREPRRLWRRYAFGNARFVIAAARGAKSASIVYPESVAREER